MNRATLEVDRTFRLGTIWQARMARDVGLFGELLRMAAANNLVTGLRVGPIISGQYQIHIWIGPRVGDRFEWYQRFDHATAYGEAIDIMSAKAFDYCVEHWNCRRVGQEAAAAVSAFEL
jgi:hypothetical protein